MHGPGSRVDSPQPAADRLTARGGRPHNEGMTFQGIPAGAFDYFEGLVADNTKTYFQEHRSEYEDLVRAPLQALADDVAGEFGEAHLYRPYRDMRFSKDKTPYKDHQGMYVEMRNGLGWYVQVSVTGLMIAGGWYTSTSEQVARYREAVAGPAGERLAALTAETRSSGYEVSGALLKTRPRGIAADHPHLDLLRFRSMYASRQWAPEAWMGTAECGDRIVAGWRDLTPLMEWLAETVGPGDRPVGSRAGRRRSASDRSE